MALSSTQFNNYEYIIGIIQYDSSHFIPMFLYNLFWGEMEKCVKENMFETTARLQLAHHHRRKRVAIQTWTLATETSGSTPGEPGVPGHVVQPYGVHENGPLVMLTGRKLSDG